MPKVFLSYRHVEPDAIVASELEHFLSAHEVAVFRDSRIQPGQDWSDSIDANLKESQYLVVLLSRASANNPNVCEEVVRAHTLGLTILPVRLEFDVATPYRLGSLLGGIQALTWESGRTEVICSSILETILGPVMAASEMEPETGTVSLDSPYYVRRAVDTRIEKRLLRSNGATTLLRGPRQVGKSSLLLRAEARARTDGLKVASIDLQLVDNEHRQSLKTLLKHIAWIIAWHFKTELKPDEVWDDNLPSKLNLTHFVESAVLAHSRSGVALCLDEADAAFGADYCTDFFSLLRYWHESRRHKPLWNQLHLVITHATEPSLWITDRNQSPFNVGEEYLLADFTPSEVRDLCARYRVRADVDALMSLVGGHPYLVRRALCVMSTSLCTLEDLKAEATRNSGPFSNHLRHLLHTISRSPEACRAYQQILAQKRCDSEQAFQCLQGAGLVKGESRHAAAPRCELYQLYYKVHL